MLENYFCRFQLVVNLAKRWLRSDSLCFDELEDLDPRANLPILETCFFRFQRLLRLYSIPLEHVYPVIDDSDPLANLLMLENCLHRF